MIIDFLGTGTSTGVPEVGCTCKVCTSANPKDKRYRASVLITVEGKNLLIDCGPDFRSQMLIRPFAPLHGILITHEHYDHVSGIDDLRPFCRLGDIDLYVEHNVKNALEQRLPYCFAEHKYPGVPNLNLVEITEDKFIVEGVEVLPIRLMHYRLPILGFRIGGFAYLTDMKTIPEKEYEKLQNLDVLVINALRREEHISHQSLAQALEQVARIAPKRTYLTHMAHSMGLHNEVEASLPPTVWLAYDGLKIEI
ncbi:phosphoribosyl 1,2-cyclic phosphate phosphodiesterase [Dysgonomonas sp. PH5-45]|uniref:MBL fold metallo-hydrolase n=1 Tax=unclassified Dysgonomonas TaxID=2630389 RepID=UPI0024765341|nr:MULTISPECIES: MBL fold metallo-hydrolase [unclassified Dysgonomonas]MDH6354374.1 phosphoribosyl 1,2-cyclic phosphate phosphodiesterase [Dysgonomonas sp. PH5-45]MDH6387274.1 phosphoribosyl 1,2-cyclic phosphate phosphodiesterase [Dysgonomonas sp. PH5-37]